MGGNNTTVQNSILCNLVNEALVSLPLTQSLDLAGEIFLPVRDCTVIRAVAWLGCTLVRTARMTLQQFMSV